jgi:fimbrial chaperone protein
VPVALALSVLTGSASAQATFTISRVQVFLSNAVKSEVLTLANVSGGPLRFQLSVFAWDQNAQGEMVLTPTRDIVFFPPLLSLAAGEQRNIRVGTATPPGASEKTFRLFVEELPPLTAPSAGGPAEVKIRTRLGIPIFLAPPQAVRGGRVDALAVRDGRLSFELRNTGNVHLMAQTIRVVASGQGGEVVTETALEGWYLLAGGTRLYDLELPRDKCPSVHAIAVEVTTAQAVYSGRLAVPSGACRP